MIYALRMKYFPTLLQSKNNFLRENELFHGGISLIYYLQMKTCFFSIYLFIIL